MAKHKAATQITIASVQESTAFHQFVEKYWKLGVGLTAVAAVAILVPVYNRGRAERSHHDDWDELRAQANFGSGIFAQVQGGNPAVLADFAAQHRDSGIGAWAKSLEIGGQIQNEKLDEAEKSASELADAWPDHVLAAGKLYPTGDGGARTLPETIRARKSELQAWEKEHAFLFSNPELPADAPKVRLNTSKGAVVVGLYIDRAPKHADNFLERCKQGFYNGTKFHRVVRGSLVQGGDPNSISGEPETWGQGGPEETIESENDPQLRHFQGALSAWKAPGAKGSHGSQFFITTADQNQMDGQNVVFGKVLEGREVLEAIESGAVVGDRPQDPAVIESTEIL